MKLEESKVRFLDAIFCRIGVAIRVQVLLRLNVSGYQVNFFVELFKKSVEQVSQCPMPNQFSFGCVYDPNIEIH